MTEQEPTVAASIRAIAELATEQPSGVAVRAKRRGIWQETSWPELDADVRALASGLKALGIGRGDIVAVIAENSREWLLVYLAIQRLGAMLLAIPARATATDVAARATARSVRHFVCGDQEHVDAVIAAGVDPATGVVIDPVGLERYALAWLHTFSDTIEKGRSAADMDAAARRVSTVEYVGGELVDVAAAAMESCAARAVDILGIATGDRVFVASPLDDPVARSIDLAAALRTGATIHIPETPGSIGADLIQVSPTILCGPRRVFELLEIEARTLQHQTGRGRQALIEWAYRGPVGRRSSIRQWLVLRHIATRHGLSHVKRAVVIGERLSKQTRDFLQALGIEVVHVWGSPLVGGLVFAEGSVDGTDQTMLLAEDAASADAWRSQFSGEPAASTASLEAELREHEIIRRVIIVPTPLGRTAFFELDFTAAGLWMSRTHGDAVSPAKLSAAESTVSLVESEIARGGDAGILDAYVILPRPLSVSDGELTLSSEAARERLAAAYQHLARPVAARTPTLREVIS